MMTMIVGIFRTRSIFKILSNIYDGMFCKNSYLAHFFSLSSKDKESSYIFLYFEKWIFLALILRDFLYFLKEKAFLIFREMETPKKFFIFRKTETLKKLKKFEKGK